MTSALRLNPVDRLLALTLALLTVATFAVAAHAHAFCSIYCIHGDRMIETQICAGQS